MEALRLYRTRAGLSLDGLAAASGVDRGTIWKTEVGLNSPRVETLEKLAHGLGVSASQVLAAEDVLTGQRNEEKEVV